MFAADLSYLDRKRIGSFDDAVSMAAQKSWMKRSYIVVLASACSFAGLLFGPWKKTLQCMIQSHVCR